MLCALEPLNDPLRAWSKFCMNSWVLVRIVNLLQHINYSPFILQQVAYYQIRSRQRKS